MKTPEQKAKDKYKKAKNSIRVIGKLPEKKKRGATGELELFKKIALSRSVISQFHGCRNCVVAKHIDQNGRETRKTIPLEDLTPTNFSHKIPKSRGEEYRLDPDNIEIVSVAWHHYEHTKQILQVEYPN